MYDKFEQLATYAQHPVAILSAPDASEHLFVNLLLALPSEAVRIDLAGYGWYFVGVLGLMNGEPRAALCVEMSAERAFGLAQAYAQYVQPHQDDFADWARRLLELPDTREDA